LHAASHTAAIVVVPLVSSVTVVLADADATSTRFRHLELSLSPASAFFL
jgi:hypothetical protein